MGSNKHQVLHNLSIGFRVQLIHHPSTHWLNIQVDFLLFDSNHLARLLHYRHLPTKILKSNNV